MLEVEKKVRKGEKAIELKRWEEKRRDGSVWESCRRGIEDKRSWQEDVVKISGENELRSEEEIVASLKKMSKA